MRKTEDMPKQMLKAIEVASEAIEEDNLLFLQVKRVISFEGDVGHHHDQRKVASYKIIMELNNQHKYYA